MSHADFLVELGCEELPPKSLSSLSREFKELLKYHLYAAGLHEPENGIGVLLYYAAPRRLAVFVKNLPLVSPSMTATVFGPPESISFDKNGTPTKAAEGFAKKQGISVVDIQIKEHEGVRKLSVQIETGGVSTVSLLPNFVADALKNLSIPKRMRWGASRIEFVRPTQWLVMILGDEVVDCEILGQKAGRLSRGHRFHHDDVVRISKPSTYLEDLRSAYVIADFAERQTTIVEKVKALAAKENGEALMPKALIDEVSSLVEWPVPLVCSFEARFLDVPQEALISTMQDNQKYFCLVDANGKLKNRFITVANIESSAPEKIIAGNEKVVRPRLTDAEFFFKQDKKVKLESRNERLKTVVFQAQLGTVYEKAQRVSKLAAVIAEKIGADKTLAARAGILSKCDLASEMVGEFPELQGIAGYYSALHDGEHADVAKALNEQYQPRFAGDVLPSTATGACVALADRLDTLVGIFGINQPPTGSKDPFALRRAAIGLLRILIEKSYAVTLTELVGEATKNYGSTLANANTATDVCEFLLGRYRAMYEEQSIKAEVILAVQALKPDSPLDFDRRVKAVNAFAQLPEASALAAANKRVANILAKSDAANLTAINTSLLIESAEKTLATEVATLTAELAPLFAAGDYQRGLTKLASLRTSVDAFFDGVMVNAEDESLRNNRLALLAQLRALFLAVADISLLA
jgi:glycyl-tRNA synthetase beta chain